MASATRYQALPVVLDDIRRRSLAVSAVSSEDDNIRPATASAVSSEHEPSILSPNIKSPENQAFLSPSYSTSKKVSNPDDVLVNEEDVTSVLSSVEGRASKDPPHVEDFVKSDVIPFTWLPYTLRQTYLFALFALSTALALVVILLSWASSVKDGLGDDNSTSILLFGWRFTPTLVVVLFVILETLLLNDARRTEVFARLSNSSASSAASTVLVVRSHWWNDPLNALSSRRNGGLLSYVLLCAAIMNMIGSFVLSPLSAAFLSVEPTEMSRSTTFTTLRSISNATAAVSPDDETYFRSVSAQVVNLTTSVWLTDEYAIVPFWPDGFSPAPLGATIPIAAQNWTANTTIFRAELSCNPMSMKDLQKDSFQLVSDDGCSMGVVVAIPENGTSTSITNYDDVIFNGITEAEEDYRYYFPVLNAGGWWVPTSIAASNFSSPLEEQFGNGTALVNISSQCQDRYILAVNTPFDITYVQPLNISINITDSDVFSNLSSFSINAHICSSRFFMANLTTTISISSSNTSFSFDQAAFNQTKVEIPEADFNVSSFESSFYSETWPMKLNTSGYGTWMGPAAVLGARYAYDPRAMINDTLLISKAQQVEQRFLGEGLLAAFSKATSQGSTSKTGKIILTKERVVASFGIGITMGILFLFTSIMIVLVFYHSRLSRRPLNLARDPGSAAAVSSLLKLADTRSHFQGLDRLPEPLIEKRLADLNFELQPRGLMAHHATQSIPAPDSRQLSYSKDWRPFVLRGSGGLSLVFAISLLIIGLSVLFAMSESRGIYQKGLVYQFSIAFKDGYITSLAPYSILPTLVAVGARFWWVNLDDTFKRLQPYVSMTKRPVPISAGPALSYQNSAPLWSVWKAAHMKHWLLALICLGTVLMEVFTVGMSALFQRNPSSLSSTIILSRDVKLRDIPQVFLVDESSEGGADGDIGTPEILATLYGEAQILLSWMYGAVIQLSYSGSSLQWSQDEWGFAPVNLASSISGPGITSPNEPANVTLDTFALRGRLECSPVDMSNTSNWLKTWDIGNGTLFNLSAVPSADKQYHTGYELGVGYVQPTFSLGTGPFNDKEGMWSSFFANPSRVRCCANGTDAGPGLSALGYWAPVGVGSDLLGSTGHGASDSEEDPQIYTNFTVTWVIGKPFPDEWEEVWGSGLNTGVYIHYLWSEIPEVVTLNCAPIIESSNARVTVSREDEQVADYNILSVPSSYEPAWSDYYLHHNNSGENGDNVAYSIKDNVTVSWGYLFMDALLGAADSARVREVARWGYKDEPVNDRIFAFRQPGLNADMMSFSTWSILEGNHSAILDASTLAETSNKVFGTFFQHFVSENSSSGGGRAYMPLNYTLPGDFLPIINSSTTELTSYQDKNDTTVVSPTVSAILLRPVYKLQMSKVAVALCLSVLVFLGFTALLIAVGHRHYFKALPRDMNTLASIMALVYDSPKLLNWVAKNGAGGDKAHAGEAKAVIGYFQGSEGDMRWGIELVEGEAPQEKVCRKDNGSGTTTEHESLDVRSPELGQHQMS